MKKIVSMLMCVCMIFTVFACMPMNISAAYDSVTVNTYDFTSNRVFDRGRLMTDPTDSSNTVYCLPYFGLNNANENKTNLTDPKVEGYEYYDYGNPYWGSIDAKKGLAVITFDFYAKGFTNAQQIWRGYTDQYFSGSGNTVTKDGITYYQNVTGYSQWNDFGGISESADGNTAYLLDSKKQNTNFQLEKGKWYTVKQVIDLKNLTVGLYAAEKGKTLKPVIFPGYAANANNYADAYHTKITNIGYKKADLYTYTENGVTYTARVGTPTKQIGAFQIYGISQTHTGDTYTPDTFTPSTGSVDYYFDNLKVESTVSVDEAINAASSASEIGDILKYYELNGSVKLNEYAEFKDANSVNNELLNKNFASAAEVQTAYDNAVAKYDISGIKEKYYNDFEDGIGLNSPDNSKIVSDFTAEGSQSFYNHTERKGNKILDLGTEWNEAPMHLFDNEVTDGVIVYESEFLADWYKNDDGKDTEASRYNNANTTSHSQRFTLFDAKSSSSNNSGTRFKHMLTGITRFGSVFGPNEAFGSPYLQRNQWYDIRITVNTSKAAYGNGTMTVDIKKTGDADWTKTSFPQYTVSDSTNQYIHVFDGIGTNSDTSNGNNNGVLPNKIVGFGFIRLSQYVDNIIDNLSLTVYYPLHTMLAKTETKDEVKSLLEKYAAFNSINTDYTNEFDADVDYDKVYSALIGKTFATDADIQTEYNRLCDANLILDDYIVNIENTSSDGKTLYNVKGGETFGTNVSFVNTTSDDEDVILINALYDKDNSLIALNKTEPQKAKGNRAETPLSLSMTVNDSADISYIRQFVLESTDTLKPYCKANTLYCVPSDYKPTLYLVGDSICQDYDPTVPSADTAKTFYPYQGWGYYMEDKLNGVTVVNKARGGWTTEHFVHPENKDGTSVYPDYTWDAFKNQIKPGDYVLVGLGINDSGSGNVSESRYVENLEVMYNDTVNAGATPLYSTPSIDGGKLGSADGWTYSLTNNRAKRGEVCRKYAESKGAVCVPFGKTISETYEAMYQANRANYSSDADARDYVRRFFHIYQADLTAGTFGYAFTDAQIKNHNGNVRNADDSTHVNYNGAEKLAEIMCSLIKESDCSLKNYVK